MAGALNAHGRLLYFYGVGICVASDYNDHEQFKFEACILSQVRARVRHPLVRVRARVRVRVRVRAS